MPVTHRTRPGHPTRVAGPRRVRHGASQFASGALGLVVLAVWGLRRLARTVPDPEGLRSTADERRVAWALVAAGAVAGAVVALLAFSGTPERTLFRVVTLGGAAAAAGLVLACALWWGRTLRPAEVGGERG